MVGFTGGSVDGDALSSMVEPLRAEAWYELEQLQTNHVGIAQVHHGDKDPNGHTVWEGDRGIVFVHGTVANPEQFTRGIDGLCEAFLADPAEILPELDGPFAIAGFDRERDETLVATDKVGTRTCYYSDEDGLLFGTHIESLLMQVDDPEINVRTIEDMLTFGHAYGSRTLVREIKSVPPASLVRHRDGETTLERYWERDFGELPAEGYVDRTLRIYREMLSDVADTIDGQPGLWLSGGLDSRTMAAVLDERLDSLRTFTYDGNPGGGVNLEPAKAVANHLDLENEVTPFTP
ncbi:MAG: asparagine synthase-related protein, partial [Halorientalis sp.]